MNVRVADNLRFRLKSFVAGTTVRWAWLMETAPGVYQTGEFSQVAAVSLTSYSSFLGIGKGRLISLECTVPNGTLARGDTVAECSFHIGNATTVGPSFRMLLGWPDDLVRMFWMPDAGQDSVSRTAPICSVNVPQPAAGAEFASVTEEFSIEEVIAFRGVLVADATVATRTPRLSVGPFGLSAFLTPASAGIAASATGVFAWQMFAPTPSIVTGQGNGVISTFASSSEVTVLTNTTNIQAGDQWSQGLVTFRGGLSLD